MIVESDRSSETAYLRLTLVGNTMYKVLLVTLVLAYGVGPQ
jgi:hypothetical protein